MDNINSFLEAHKNSKIVFTNGCFDILHRGHVTYLNEAKGQGDILVVGLNSDASVKRLKGDERPINNESDRKFVLENLKAIDFVEIFSEDTPLNLIKKIIPNVLVKGGDWSIDQIVGSEFVIENGGEVKSLKFIDGHSTTSTIEKINETSS
jgi:rfaE bifunctional protein nucleotidyltransferase chain/domain